MEQPARVLRRPIDATRPPRPAQDISARTGPTDPDPTGAARPDRTHGLIAALNAKDEECLKPSGVSMPFQRALLRNKETGSASAEPEAGGSMPFQAGLVEKYWLKQVKLLARIVFHALLDGRCRQIELRSA